MIDRFPNSSSATSVALRAGSWATRSPNARRCHARSPRRYRERCLLVGVALSLSVFLGVIVGVLQATRRNSWLDRGSSALLLTLYSLPDFWAALMISLLFGIWWKVLPPNYMVDPVLHDYMRPWDAFIDRVRHLILPVATLTLLTMAGIARYQRSAMLEVLPADYIRTARAKGLSERAIVLASRLPKCAHANDGALGLLFPALLGGSLFVERVFSWPGMGLLASEAIGGRDYDLVTATVIIGSVMVVV